MQEKKKEHPTEKSRLHPRNKHRQRYDFKSLVSNFPELGSYVTVNPYQDESIDFFDPQAVKMLNKALLKQYYGIDNWDISENYLCPPIPGRVDYLHHIADLLSSKNYGKIPKGDNIRIADIGVGANCIYPILGIKEYDWSFVGTDIDSFALESAQRISDSNPSLKNKIELRFQKNPQDAFFGVIKKEERFELSICNPPFHASAEEASASSIRKLSNLTHTKITSPELNFGGKSNELWCDGGEEKFLKNMIRESKFFASNFFWFSSLVSKQSNLKNAYAALKKADAIETKTIQMGQGNKSSRILAWTFLTPEQQNEWTNKRWRI